MATMLVWRGVMHQNLNALTRVRVHRVISLVDFNADLRSGEQNVTRCALISTTTATTRKVCCALALPAHCAFALPGTELGGVPVFARLVW